MPNMPANHPDNALSNGHDETSHPSQNASTGSRKGSAKSKKASGGPASSDEATRLLQARISQLEQDATADKEQEAEIEREVKRAHRDMINQTAKMDDVPKIDFLMKKSSDLLAEMRRVDRENQKNRKRGDVLQKERDNSRSDLSKQVQLKEKLEKLCRELQKDNNKLKTENKELYTTHVHAKSASDERFAQVLARLEGCQEDRDVPKKQVVDIAMEDLFKTRFKSLIDQYELRELHFHSLMRTKELEVQYHMSRYEREKKNAEAESSKSRQLQSQVQAFTKTETELRNQLNIYVDKFKQVEDTLNNSNDLFLSFRKEMEDMSKKGKRLEKENDALKRHKDATNANIIRMAEERQEWKRKSDEADRKSNKLMSIIQGMQQQGRQVPPNLASTLDSYNDPHPQGEGDEEESEYSEEEEELSEFDEAEDDEDTEDEVRSGSQAAPVYGPERPPHQQVQHSVNGH